MDVFHPLSPLALSLPPLSLVLSLSHFFLSLLSLPATFFIQSEDSLHLRLIFLPALAVYAFNYTACQR